MSQQIPSVKLSNGAEFPLLGFGCVASPFRNPYGLVLIVRTSSQHLAVRPGRGRRTWSRISFPRRSIPLGADEMLFSFNRKPLRSLSRPATVTSTLPR